MVLTSGPPSPTIPGQLEAPLASVECRRRRSLLQRSPVDVASALERLGGVRSLLDPGTTGVIPPRIPRAYRRTMRTMRTFFPKPPLHEAFGLVGFGFLVRYRPLYAPTRAFRLQSRLFRQADDGPLNGRQADLRH